MTQDRPLEPLGEEGDKQVQADLLNRARHGDRSALGDLLENHRNYLLLIANAELDRDIQGKLGASDVVQQTMFQAQKQFEQFDGTTPQALQAWLRKIVVNDVRKAKRHFATLKRAATQEVNLQDHSEVQEGLRDNQPTPGTEAIRQEKLQALESALDRLSPDHREVIHLRNFNRLSFEEIGRCMGRSADATRKLWARALLNLESDLTDRAPESLTGLHRKREKHK